MRIEDFLLLEPVPTAVCSSYTEKEPTDTTKLTVLDSLKKTKAIAEAHCSSSYKDFDITLLHYPEGHLTVGTSPLPYIKQTSLPYPASKVKSRYIEEHGTYFITFSEEGSTTPYYERGLYQYNAQGETVLVASAPSEVVKWLTFTAYTNSSNEPCVYLLGTMSDSTIVVYSYNISTGLRETVTDLPLVEEVMAIEAINADLYIVHISGKIYKYTKSTEVVELVYTPQNTITISAAHIETELQKCYFFSFDLQPYGIDQSSIFVIDLQDFSTVEKSISPYSQSLSFSKYFRPSCCSFSTSKIPYGLILSGAVNPYTNVTGIALFDLTTLEEVAYNNTPLPLLTGSSINDTPQGVLLMGGYNAYLSPEYCTSAVYLLSLIHI